MTTDEIYQHYRSLVKKHVVSTGFVLKTDCFNEAEGGEKDFSDLLDAKRTTYIELDPATVSRAKVRHPERYFVCGDIRQMNFADSIFSMIIDLSTLDHIGPADIQDAVNEYSRVLVQHGKLLLVVWCSDTPEDDPVIWHNLQQYFFDEELVMSCLWKAGICVWQKREFHRSKNLYLIEVIGEKL